MTSLTTMCHYIKQNFYHQFIFLFHFFLWNLTSEYAPNIYIRIVSRIRKYYYRCVHRRSFAFFNAIVVIARMPRARFSTTLSKCERASDRLCIWERCLLSVNWTLCRTPLLCLFTLRGRLRLSYQLPYSRAWSRILHTRCIIPINGIWLA